MRDRIYSVLFWGTDNLARSILGQEITIVEKD
ncbi:hypothetical protein QBD00_004297 [Ochrobactrum sp. AN78]|nr:hypothetical protein [Ochrobactrum sp. AN78]